MAIVYVVDSTDGDSNKSITIKPGALNGPGSTLRDSDLRLYGMGALQWGEGMDENVYRIAENFACPEKIFGDYNPATLANDYNPATDPVLPRDERDLGPGNGITVPLEGQTWYNSTRQLVYVYDKNILGWKTLSGVTVDITSPQNPQPGDLWYDTSGTDPGGCTTDPLLKIYDPTHPDAAPDGFVTTGENSLRQCGDFMSGILDMGGPDGGATTRYRIVNLGTPIDPFDAVTKQYTDAIGDDLVAHEADFGLHLTTTQNTWLDGLNLPTLTATEANRLVGVTSLIQPQLNDKISRTGDIMDTSQTLTLGRHPVATFEAATQGFVLTEVQAADFMTNDPVGKGFAPETGDVQAVGATLQMYLAGTGWVQIWPAQYTA